MSDSQTVPSNSPKRIGVAADRGGFELKEYLAGMLREAHYEVVDFGDGQPKPDDDYPDFARMAYQNYKEIFAGDRFRKLAAKGARVQRLLWASTGAKNPDYIRGGEAYFRRVSWPGGLLPKTTVHPDSVSTFYVRPIEALPSDD
jgi:hypothetical protein